MFQFEINVSPNETSLMVGTQASASDHRMTACGQSEKFGGGKLSPLHIAAAAGRNRNSRLDGVIKTVVFAQIPTVHGVVSQKRFLPPPRDI